MASGGTDADGRYSLSTKRPGDGGYLGRHKLMIVPWLPTDSDDSAEAAAARTRPRPNIPKPYHSATTPLSVEVTAKGPNVFDFELATEDGRPRRERFEPIMPAGVLLQVNGRDVGADATAVERLR